MYDVRPNLIVGFHGCDAEICQKLLNNPNEIEISKKPYDWLGNGLYFWENNQERAYQWAKQKEEQGHIKKAAVIGAVINLNYCCDLVDRKYILMLSQYHELMKIDHTLSGTPLPQNTAPKGTPPHDKVQRKLDCAVIEFMHSTIYNARKKDIELQGYSKYKIFDSVRGVFIEGEPVYEDAGFNLNTHIQICVRNQNCVLGFFMPRDEVDFDNYLENLMKNR